MTSNNIYKRHKIKYANAIQIDYSHPIPDFN